MKGRYLVFAGIREMYDVGDVIIFLCYFLFYFMEYVFLG